MIEYITGDNGWLNTYYDLVLLSNTDALETGGNASNKEDHHYLIGSSNHFNTLQIEKATTLTIGGNFEGGNVIYEGEAMQFAVQAIEFETSGGTLYIASQSGAISEDSKATDDNVVISVSSKIESAKDAGSFLEGYISTVIDTSATAVRAAGVLNVKGTLSGTFNATSNAQLSYYMLNTGDLEATSQAGNNIVVASGLYSKVGSFGSGDIVIENGSDATFNSDSSLAVIINKEPASIEAIVDNTAQSFGVYTQNVDDELMQEIIDALGLDEDEFYEDTFLGKVTAEEGVFAGTINSTTHDVTISYNMNEQENDIFVKYVEEGGSGTTDPEGETTDPEGETVPPGESGEEEEEPDYATSFTIADSTIGAYGVSSQIMTYNSFNAQMNIETTNVNIEAGLAALADDSFTLLSNNIVESIGLDGYKLNIADTYTGETNIILRNVAFEIFEVSGDKFAVGNEVNASGIRMDDDSEGYVDAEGNMEGTINIAVSDINMVEIHSVGNDQYYLNVSGIYAANDVTVSGGLNSDIAITLHNVTNMSANSVVVGVYGNNVDIQYFGGSINISASYDTDFAESLDFTGRIVGIWAQENFTNENDGIVDIIGDIYVDGYIYDENDAPNDVFIDSIAIMGGQDTALNLRISGTVISSYWAVFAGEYDNVQGYIRYNTDDNVTVAAGGFVYGIVELYNGTNSFTIDSNAQFIGNVDSRLGSLNVTFKLNNDTFTGELAQDGNSIIVLNNGDEYMLASTTTITVDITDVSVGTEYILVEESDVALWELEWEKWEKREISVVYQGKTISMMLGQDYSDSNFTISSVIDSDSGKISFTVEELDEVSYAATTGCKTEVATFKNTKEDYLLLSWDAVSDASTYILEYSINGGDTIEVEISGKTSYFELTDLEDGDNLSWRVRTYTTNNKTTEWTKVYSYDVDVADSKITGLDSTEFANNSQGGSSVVQIDWVAPESEYDIVAYEVRYVATPTNGEIDWDNITYITKVVSGTSAIISGVNNMDYVYWQVRAIDSRGTMTDWNDCSGDTFRVYVGDTTAPEFDMNSVVASVSFSKPTVEVSESMMTVSLSWKAAVDEDGMSGLAGYQLSYREVDEDGEAVGDWKIVNLSGDVTSWEGTMENGTYEWKINAYDYAGNKSEDYIGAKWHGDSLAPIFANGENLKSEVVSDGKGDNTITFSWGKASDNLYIDAEGSGLKGYTLYIQTPDILNTDGEVVKAGTILEEFEFGSDVTSFELSSKEYDFADGSYSWYVEAEDNSGNIAKTEKSDFGVDTIAPSGGLDGAIDMDMVATWESTSTANPNGSVSTKYFIETITITMDIPGVYADDNKINYVLQICDDNMFSSDVIEYEFAFNPTGEIREIDSKVYTVGSNTIVFGDSSAEFGAGALVSMGGTAYYRLTVKDSMGNQSSTWYYDSLDLTDPANGEKIVDNIAPEFPEQMAYTTTVQGDTVDLSWTAATDAMGVEYYEVKFVGIDGTGGSYIVNSKQGEASLSSDTLKEGCYKWSVRAVDWSGQKSEWSTFTLDEEDLEEGAVIVDNTLVIDRTDPILDTASVDHKVLLNDLCISWDKASDNVDVDHYVVMSSTYDSVYGGYLAWAEDNVDADKTSYWMNNLSGASVAYKVCAVDKAGNKSEWSEIKYASLDTDSDAGSSFATATKAEWGESYENAIGRSDAIDMYEFTMDHAGSVTFTISDVEGLLVNSYGVKVVLYNEDGKALKSLTAAGNSTDKVISMLLDIDDGGKYYLKVTPSSSSTEKNLANYTVSGEVTYFDEADITNNSIAKATELTLDANNTASATGWIGYGDTADYYAIDANGAGEVTVKISDITEKVTVSLYNEAGKKVKSLSTSTGKVVFDDLLVDGKYYIGVTGGSTSSAKYNTNYTITVEEDFFPAATANNSLDAATALTLEEGSATGWVGFGDAVDYYKVSTDGAGEVSVFIKGLDSKVTVALYNEAGKKVKSLSTDDEKVVFGDVLIDGDYYISVTSADNGKGKYNTDYTIEVSEDFFPAATANNTLAAATGISLCDGVATGWVGYGDAVDYYKVTTDGAGEVSVSIGGLDSKVTVALYNEVGKKIKSLSTYADKVVFDDILVDGNYYISVTSADNGKGKYNTDYTISVTEDFFPEATKNNSMDDATVLSLDNGSATGWIGYGDTADYYKVITDGAGEVTVNIAGLTEKLTISLYNEAGKKIKSMTAYGDKVVFDDVLVDGSYYIGVTGGSTSSAKYNTDYTITVEEDFFPAATANNTLATATDISLCDGSATGWVGYGDAVDYYKVTTDGAGEVSVSIAGLDSKVTVALYNEAGKKIKSLSTSADKLVFDNLLVDGDYYISVTSGDNGKGKYNTGYTIAVNEEFFPEATDNNWIAKATALNLEDGAVSGWIGYGDIADYYKVTTDGAGKVTVAVSDLDYKVTVALYNEAGKKVKSISTYTDKVVFDDLLVDGNYYIGVTGGSTSSAKYNTNYTLAVTEDFFPEATANNSMAEATVVEFEVEATSATVSDWVGYGDEIDYFKFEIAEAGAVSFDLDYDDDSLKLGSQIKLVVFDDAGKKVSLKDYSSDLEAGTYFASVEISDEKKYDTGYDLTINLA